VCFNGNTTTTTTTTNNNNVASGQFVGTTCALHTV
jgi:hypothetical protein